jgi:acyl-CoA thioester hydrolase
MTTPLYQHTLAFDVRDYECDLQGIVNNANYQHYLEHARHQFLKQKNLDFAALAAQGINLVVVRVEIDYLWPLRSGDRFEVRSHVERVSRLRFAFNQNIYRLSDEKAIIAAKVIGTAINAQGRPMLIPEVEALLRQP